MFTPCSISHPSTPRHPLCLPPRVVGPAPYTHKPLRQQSLNIHDGSDPAAKMFGVSTANSTVTAWRDYPERARVGGLIAP